MRALNLIVAATLFMGASADLEPTTPVPARDRPATRATGQSRRPRASVDPPTQVVALPGLDQFDQTRAYVAVVGAGTIAALDLRTNKIAWSLRVSSPRGKQPARTAMGIAASPDGRWVYTGDAIHDEIVFVDADARRVVKRIPVSYTPHAIDIDESGNLLWVSGRGPDFPWLSSTTLIDTRTQKVIETFTPGLGVDAHYAFTPDGSEVWGASITTRLASVYQAHSGKVLAAVPLYVDHIGTSPEARLGVGLIAYNEPAISPDGKRVYVVGPDPEAVFELDVPSRAVLRSVTLDQRPHGVAVTRDGREVWTVNDVGTVTVLDADSLATIETFRFHKQPGEVSFAHIAFSYDGTRAYLSFVSDITVVDVRTRKIVSRIDVGPMPMEISLEDYYVRLPTGRRVTPDHPD